MSGTATVVYDGECGFCTAAAGLASRHLHGPVAAVPIADADLTALGVPAADARRSLQWVGPDGARLQGHRAVAAWLRSGGRGWPVAGSLMTAPGLDLLSAGAYRIVAANRRRIPGRWSRACAAPLDDVM